jgi:DNA polymerase/3'-5' exonuclease PolX
MLVQSLATELADYLRSSCARLEIAGSIRRLKADPRDIEIVAIPKIVHEPVRNLFDEVVGDTGENLLDTAIASLISAEQWEFDSLVKRNGEKYKRLRHIQHMVCCDLFITTAEKWGVIFALRTGPGDFSQELVTHAKRIGMKIEEGLVYRTHRDGRNTIIPTLEEPDFFAVLSVPNLEPSKRTFQALRRAIYG